MSVPLVPGSRELAQRGQCAQVSASSVWHGWCPCPTLSVSPLLQAGGKWAAGDRDRRLGDAG